MPTPLMHTTAVSSHRPASTHPTSASERLLAAALVAALVAVAALAMLLPSGSSTSADSDQAVVSSGQIARGKATVPGSASYEQRTVAPNTL